ncbi:MAG: hypothetical protein KDK06_08245 [Gammaproteobacteria bacterium]|nr:hypothetical protein [Gammaproteobacteria bacterium]
MSDGIRNAANQTGLCPARTPFACRIRRTPVALLCAGVLSMVAACSQEGADTPAQSANAPTSPRASTDAVEIASPEPSPAKAVEQHTEKVATATAEVDTPAEAPEPAQHEIKGVVTQWAPLVTFAAPGDTIVFRQMTGHDSEALEGMIPTGAEPWKSALGEEGFSVTLTEPGAYMFKCNPHVSMGMVGAIVVGEVPPANLAAIEASPQNKGMIGRAIRKLKQALDAH